MIKNNNINEKNIVKAPNEIGDLLHEVQDMMQECSYEPVECEEIIASELGLEPDYICDILGL